MKSRKLIYILFCIFISCKNKNTEFTVQDGLVISNITVISPANGSFKPYIGHVITDANSIVYAGKDLPVVKGNFQKIDGQGKYLIPGLIDSHVHLANIAGMNNQDRKKHPELAAAYFEQLPKSFLYFGYTTLIDVNNYAPQLINKIKSSPVSPDIFACGEQVQVMDDFMMEMEAYPRDERYGLPFLYDKYNKNISIPDSVNLTEHSAKTVITNIAKQQEGFCVKTLYEDETSGLKQSWQLPTKEIMLELVKEAHAQNMPVILHAPSYKGQKFALETGVDIIAHAMWNWTGNPAELIKTEMPEMHQKLLLQIANKKIGYQPTLRAILAEIDIMNNSFGSDPLLDQVYPKNFLAWLKTDAAPRAREKIMNRAKYLKVVNPEFYKAVRSSFESDEQMFTELYKLLKIKAEKVTRLMAGNNANLLFSTDGVAMNMYTNPPGYNGFLEMNHWLQAGVSLEKILLAATVNNARAFKIDHLYGTIEAGKKANTLIMNANPLESINAYNEIDVIIIKGKAVKRNALSAQAKK